MLVNCWGFRWYANLFGWWKKSLKMNYYRHCCFTSINLDFYQNHWHVIWREDWHPSKGEIRPRTTGQHTHTHVYRPRRTDTNAKCTFIHWIFYPKIICHRSIEEKINSMAKHGKCHTVNICAMVFTLKISFFVLSFFYEYIIIALMICSESGCFFLYKHTAHNIIVPLWIQWKHTKKIVHICNGVIFVDLTLLCI